MKNILLKILLLTLTLSSCSTQPIKFVPAPSPNRLEVLKKSLEGAKDLSEELAIDYLRALKAKKEGNNELACTLFTDLSENKRFAIKESALLHSLSVCDFSNRELKSLWKKSIVPKHLLESYSDLSLKLAIQKNIPEFEAQFSFDLIPFRPLQAEKVKLIKRALAIAEEMQDALKMKIYSDRLKEISPLYTTEMTPLNIYSVAKDFETNRQFEKARILYKQMIDGEFPIENIVKAYNALRMSYKIERNLKMFLVATYEMADFLKSKMDKNESDPDFQKIVGAWVDSKIAIAKAVWTEHRNLEARTILDELVTSKLGSDNQKANIQLIYGSLYQESSENKQALKYFESAALFTITDIALEEKIQWAIVWNNYLSKKYNKVVEYSDKFVKKSNNQIFTVKLNYWKAKALQHLNKQEEANELFSFLFSSDPFGYYGIISSVDLKLPLAPIPLMNLKKELTGIDVLDWLLAMNEQPDAQKYLKEINSRFKTPIEREKAMVLYLQTQWYQGGMRQIYNFKMSNRNAMTEKYIDVVFPIPYLNTVEKLSTQYSVPVELIFGIIRQESAFVASERSWADAFGLMQLIPEKAQELSRKFGISYHDYNDLYIPETNLEMGTATLKELREKFDSKFIQSVAGYNASSDAIITWERERFKGDYFEFIEEIPYEETRNYVKLVFRNYIVYKRMMSKEEFTIDKDFFANPF
jgi:soluble lytic murein transglycosylase